MKEVKCDKCGAVTELTNVEFKRFKGNFVKCVKCGVYSKIK